MKNVFEANWKAAETDSSDLSKQSGDLQMIHPLQLNDFKEKLSNIFSFETGKGSNLEGAEQQIREVSEQASPRFVTLEDGTIIEIPDPGKTSWNPDLLRREESSFQQEEESSFEKGEMSRVDDNGTVYMIDGELVPNTEYELNGNRYKTDDQGRIISCEAKPKRSPENPNDPVAQGKAGGEDRRAGDQGGHIVGRDLNGDSGAGNLVAMDSRINQSDYKRMENDIKSALDEGKDVTLQIEFTYNDSSNRPDIITVKVTVDGRDTIYRFDNNLDNSLKKEVPEAGRDTVESTLERTGGQISSIKKEFDREGNLTVTTVSITYVGENGVNYRTKVVIDHTGGNNNP